MPWLELSLVVRIEQQPHAEEALGDLGAQAITLQDANAETPDEKAIFEPGVGELPLWPTITLNALFDADTDRRGLTETLAELLPWLEPDQLTFRDVADQNWERAWMASKRLGVRSPSAPLDFSQPQADNTNEHSTGRCK